MEIIINHKDFFFKLLKMDEEVCGFLINNLIVVDTVGEAINKRKECVLSRYEDIIFHTHPNSTKPYPSAEDFLKIFKKRKGKNPIISFVITVWGVWEIKCTEKKEVTEVDSLLTTLRDIILKRIYEQGGIYNEKVIKYTCYNVMNFLKGMEVNFKVW